MQILSVEYAIEEIEWGQGQDQTLELKEIRMPFLQSPRIDWRDDGVPRSRDFGDIYFSPEDGLAETEHVFLSGIGFEDLVLRGSDIIIGETGFGTGLDFLATMRAWREQAGPKAHLHFLSVEGFPLCKHDLGRALEAFPSLAPLTEKLLEQYPPPLTGFHRLVFEHERVTLTLMFGDVLDQLRACDASIDAWYLDGFAPQHNADMWSQDVFNEVARLSRPDARAATFTVAGKVRRGLQKAGFGIERRPGFGNKRECLVAMFQGAAKVSPEKPWYRRASAQGRRSSVAIVGAGIAGLSLAHVLRREGVTVDIYEREAAIAQGGSGNPSGMINPRMSLGQDAEAEFRSAAFMHAAKTYKAHPAKGVLQLALNREAEQRQAKWLEAELLPDSWLQPKTPSEVSKLLGIDVSRGGLLASEARFISPTHVCDHLAEGQPRHTNTNIKRLERTSSGWILIDGHDRIAGSAETVALANAADILSFSQTQDLPMDKSRGQISLVPATEMSRKLSVGLSYGGYLSPAFEVKGEGWFHVLGATKDWVDADASDKVLTMRTEDHLDNLQKLADVADFGFEGLDPETLKGRASFRASTPDRLPMIGPAPVTETYRRSYQSLHHGNQYELFPDAEYHDGLFLMAGFGARGFQWAPFCAEILAAQIIGIPSPVSRSVAEILHPARFVIRELKRPSKQSRGG